MPEEGDSGKRHCGLDVRVRGEVVKTSDFCSGFVLMSFLSDFVVLLAEQD